MQTRQIYEDRRQIGGRGGSGAGNGQRVGVCPFPCLPALAPQEGGRGLAGMGFLGGVAAGSETDSLTAAEPWE